MAAILVVEDNVLAFKEGEDIVYEIPIDSLNGIRIRDKEKHSEWIEHLTGYARMTVDLLYQLAKKINDHHPDNGINWQSQFEDVEYRDYLDKAYELKEMVEQKPQKSLSQELRDVIEFNHSENGKDTGVIIKKLVEDKLKQYGIVN